MEVASRALSLEAFSAEISIPRVALPLPRRSMTHADPSNHQSLLQDLQACFPVFRDAQPLAIGIDGAILQRQPSVDRNLLRRALHQYTTSTRYLKVLQGAHQRFDLDGNPAGEVSEDQRAHAAETLKMRFQKMAQIRKEKAEAAAAAARQQEKLSRLVSKFSR